MLVLAVTKMWVFLIVRVSQTPEVYWPPLNFEMVFKCNHFEMGLAELFSFYIPLVIVIIHTYFRKTNMPSGLLTLESVAFSLAISSKPILLFAFLCFPSFCCHCLLSEILLSFSYWFPPPHRGLEIQINKFLKILSKLQVARFKSEGGSFTGIYSAYTLLCMTFCLLLSCFSGWVTLAGNDLKASEVLVRLCALLSFWAPWFWF